MVTRLLGPTSMGSSPATPPASRNWTLACTATLLGFWTSTHSSKPGRVAPSGRYHTGLGVRMPMESWAPHFPSGVWYMYMARSAMMNEPSMAVTMVETWVPGGSQSFTCTLVREPGGSMSRGPATGPVPVWKMTLT